MSSNKSVILSDKVEANLSDVMANLKLLVKELASGDMSSQMEVEKLMLQAEKDELEAAKLELEADRAKFKAEKLEFEAEKLRHKTKISLLQKDKLNLAAEMEKKLDQCWWCKDKKAMQDDKAKPKVFLDVAINGTNAGRVTIELDVDTTPLTAENFRALCTGEKGIGKSGKPLHYKGSKFHRIDDNICLGGDIVGNTCKGDSIYGPTFPAENLTKKHINLGTVGMVRQGKDTQVCNGSQFYITTATAEDFDGQNVVFGRVVDGMNVVMEIQKAGSNASVITGCGQLS